MKSVNAQILSVIENDDIQAFLLSESSLLVSKRRVIIKTCGTTKCLQVGFRIFTEKSSSYRASKTEFQSLELIIAAAKKFCNLNLVQDIFYSSQVLTYSSNIGPSHVVDINGKARIVNMTGVDANLGLR